MNRCPITYQECSGKYSDRGLKKLSPKLTSLADLPFSAEEQRREAAERAVKMSIQGVQAKLSAKLNVTQARFDLVDTGGTYILKPQSALYEQIAENEDLSMHLASMVGIDVPLHGLVYSADKSITYFIKRFDRFGKNKKYALEDFAQLAGKTRDTKYDFSMERMIPIIEEHCTFPVIEKEKFFLRTLFSFLIGNEDMHLKNFSLITKNNKVELSPAYDLVNSTIAIKNATEELALPLRGKKKRLTRDDLIVYFGHERLGLPMTIINGICTNLTKAVPEWLNLIKVSFLSEEMKTAYSQLVHQRCRILFGDEMI